MDTLDIPVVDLTPLLDSGGDLTSSSVMNEAKKTAEALHQYGVLCIRDPRASAAGVTNDEFIDMLEQYFEQPTPIKDADVRADIWYQLGRTPSGVELPRNHCERMKAFKGRDTPLSLCPPERDPKERFFWRPAGATRPEKTAFPQLNAPAVIPTAFPHWATIMDGWGGKLLDAAFSVATLAALGFGLPAATFTDRMTHGPHLLAPTASDFNTFGAENTVLAGYHYDLNFITAHGASRYPGLAVWTRSGEKKWVKMPPGCLLVQAGKQFEHMTAGHVLAGFHEVVVSPDTVKVIERAKRDNTSMWRISSTLFAHIASDVTIEPVGHFADNSDTSEKVDYPKILAGDFVAAELAAINLGEGSKGVSSEQ